MSKDNQYFDEVTYGETRNINIGDYESRSIFFSLKTRVKKINKKNNTISIHDYEKCSVEEFDGDVAKTFNHAKELVDERLNTRERRIRKWAETWTGDYLLTKIENPPK
jgi:hypothetical protein